MADVGNPFEHNVFECWLTMDDDGWWWVLCGLAANWKQTDCVRAQSRRGGRLAVVRTLT